MRTVYVFLACCLAVTLANSESDALLAKYLNECKTELNISDSFTLPKGEKATFGCVMFCLRKKQGWMNEDGTFNKDAIIADIQRKAPDRKEVFEKLLDACEKTVKPADGCKLAACLVPDGPNE